MSSKYSAILSIGVSGLRVRPLFFPFSRIVRRSLRTSVLASTWMVMTSEPASANCGDVPVGVLDHEVRVERRDR